MKIKENFIEEECSVLLSDWGNKKLTLKYKYDSEFDNSIKSYKLTQEQLKEYLKTGVMPGV